MHVTIPQRDASDVWVPDRIYQLLLVEDSWADVRLLKEALRSWRVRHCLAVVEDGVEALDYLYHRGNYDGAARPDLILLDINMPRMGGLELLRSIKADPHLRQIPVIVFTSSSSPSDVNAAYELQASCFITKPTDLNDFYGIMKAIESFWFRVAEMPPPELPPTCESNLTQ